MISVDKNERIFTLLTDNTAYQIKADKLGFLLHLYYGPRVENVDFSYLIQPRDRGFSGNPADANGDRRVSADTFPLEYPCTGIGDFRESCLEAIFPNGSCALDLRYESYKITAGKPKLNMLPAFYADENESQTLEIKLRDRASELVVCVQYSVLPEYDIITRSAKIVNNSRETVRLTRALSCCLDLMQPSQRDLVTFFGRHAGEREFQRSRIAHGKQKIDSCRGASSLHYNPFAIVCGKDTTEIFGECMGMLFVYSGNFVAQAEEDQARQLRVVMGINPQSFCWQLKSGESFQTPEAALCLSEHGFEGLSQRLHRAINNNLVRGSFKNKPRPALINNWEATYFNFNDKKLLEIAEKSSELGVELFVLDDGWFGRRNDDTTSLGDWYVNEDKIKCGLSALAEKIHRLKLKFGLWFEPEMISFESELYKSHPDWLLAAPNRPPVSSRCQYVLDMSRSEVLDYLYERISALISEAKLDYIKWDMNRNISDVWSGALPADRQGELLHRYILGVYSLLERLTASFPDVLFESCSGGGGRFDAGMLYYTPQIWCSDNTDPIERLKIQYGTSFAYPSSTVGAHVSASPNHQTGRTTPLKTRAIVAMTGAFGCELDPTALDAKQAEEIKAQIELYKAHRSLFSYGDYYRLSPPNDYVCAWSQVDANRASAVVSAVVKSPCANDEVVYVKLRGLDPDRIYSILPLKLKLSGKALMSAGFPLPEMRGDYPAVQCFLEAEKQEV